MVTWGSGFVRYIEEEERQRAHDICMVFKWERERRRLRRRASYMGRANKTLKACWVGPRKLKEISRNKEGGGGT